MYIYFKSTISDSSLYIYIFVEAFDGQVSDYIISKTGYYHQLYYTVDFATSTLKCF